MGEEEGDSEADREGDGDRSVDVLCSGSGAVGDAVSNFEVLVASMLLGIPAGVAVIGLLTFLAWALDLVHLTRAF